MSRRTQTRNITLAVTAALACSAATSTALADQFSYIGVHPIATGGFCHIEVAHVHAYAPTKKKKRRKLLYRVHNDHYHFVGDPVAHGYRGKRVSYYGHHPVVVADATIHAEADDFCYLDGPHYHSFAPPASASFEIKGDAHWYVGAYPAAYKRHRRARVRINSYYATAPYVRPVVTVEPPRAYVGAIFTPPVPPVIVPPVPSVRVNAHARAPRAHASFEVRAPVPHVTHHVHVSHGRKHHRGRKYRARRGPSKRHHHYRGGGRGKHRKAHYKGKRRKGRGKYRNVRHGGRKKHGKRGGRKKRR